MELDLLRRSGQANMSKALKFDLQKIRADGYPLTTPVVVTNSDAFSDVTVVASGNVTEGQNILLLR